LNEVRNLITMEQICNASITIAYYCQIQPDSSYSMWWPIVEKMKYLVFLTDNRVVKLWEKITWEVHINWRITLAQLIQFFESDLPSLNLSLNKQSMDITISKSIAQKWMNALW
jgi:hypothetical protein